MLLEHLLLNRLIPVAEKYFIEEQTGFRPGKSTIGQLPILTQHIENGFHKKITRAVFVDLSDAYDTVNHRLLLKKILDTPTTCDLPTFLGKCSGTNLSLRCSTKKRAEYLYKRMVFSRQCACPIDLLHIHEQSTAR